LKPSGIAGKRSSQVCSFGAATYYAATGASFLGAAAYFAGAAAACFGAACSAGF